MGTAFGVHISRNRRFHSLYAIIFLTTLYLIAFFVAKGVDHKYWLASTLYVAPHVFIICASIRTLKCIAQGKE